MRGAGCLRLARFIFHRCCIVLLVKSAEVRSEDDEYHLPMPALHHFFSELLGLSKSRKASVSH